MNLSVTRQFNEPIQNFRKDVEIGYKPKGSTLVKVANQELSTMQRVKSENLSIAIVDWRTKILVTVVAIVTDSAVETHP